MAVVEEILEWKGTGKNWLMYNLCHLSKGEDNYISHQALIIEL